MKFPREPKKWGVKRLELMVLIVGCLILGYACTKAPEKPAAEPPPAPEFSTAVPVDQSLDFSKFEHSSVQHQGLPCLLCHIRDDKSTKPKFSGHLPCAGCHLQQFADNKSPMCSICHSNPENGVLKPFPALASFNFRFDHAKHSQQTNCATCHRSSRSGIAFSIPSGVAAHATCFQCHGADTEVAGRKIGSCAVCHEPGSPVRISESAKAFTENFSHARHLAGGKNNCASCHSIRAGASLAKQVSAPIPLMHSATAGTSSCATCHNNKRAFGTGDFTNCRRCHIGKTFKF